ncbi:hypothetical protein CLV24_103242 [Pontibacter ummariensis]|uniref:Uncharacterized protein n=1 Tax=Pontibacter ummariensis TaxID=1610492 RepID=A0A239CHR3_9BACT|nr:hypothetical protein CLV24_103242 [Pontibacter ummariensis]SNS19727.1 hypothetical protein SAMN06296052_10371 [Pontibacter ummariensis]
MFSYKRPGIHRAFAFSACLAVHNILQLLSFIMHRNWHKSLSRAFPLLLFTILKTFSVVLCGYPSMQKAPAKTLARAFIYFFKKMKLAYFSGQTTSRLSFMKTPKLMAIS